MSNLSELLPAGGAAKEFEVVASGTLPNGKPVVLKSDGTVEVVNIATVAGGDGITAATPAVFESASVVDLSVAMLTSTKAIVVYTDVGNSYYGTTCVLTISGTTITAGTPVVFDSAISYYNSVTMLSATKALVVSAWSSGALDYGHSHILDVSGSTITVGSTTTFNAASSSRLALTALTSTKAIVVYRDGGNSNYGTARILDVSSSTITAGTASVYESAGVEYNSVAMLTSTKAIVVYSDDGNSSYGTSCVLNVSGSTITAGTPVVFESAVTAESIVASLTSTKAIVVYHDTGNSYYGTASILDVSGSSTITAGTPVVFNSAGTWHPSVSMLTSTKAIVAYKDSGNSYYGTASILDVSGATITAGPPEVFETANTFFASVATLESTRAIVVYKDSGNSSYGTSCILDNSASATNLTATNFAGTSTAAFTNGQTATIVPQGGVSTNQSSLTIGSTYYVQPAGTLATTAGDPSVVAGKAISTTSLILKGNS